MTTLTARGPVADALLAHDEQTGETIHAALPGAARYCLAIPHEVAERPSVRLARAHLDHGPADDHDHDHDGAGVWHVERAVASALVHALAHDDEAALVRLAASTLTD